MTLSASAFDRSKADLRLKLTHAGGQYDRAVSTIADSGSENALAVAIQLEEQLLSSGVLEAEQTARQGSHIFKAAVG